MNEEKECIVIIDNSNVWIEGMKLSALKEGIKSTFLPSDTLFNKFPKLNLQE